jgi:hypothetical protein
MIISSSGLFGYLYGGYFAPVGLVGHTGAESRFKDDF